MVKLGESEMLNKSTEVHTVHLVKVEIQTQVFLKPKSRLFYHIRLN